MERNKLLIADGSSLTRSILKRIFEKDFVVLQAENGRDAFELFREHYESLAAVIVELNMSKYDGVYFMEHIASLYRTNNVPVICVAANSKDVRRIETCRYRPTDYITKPFNTDAVRQLVLDTIEKHRDYGINDEDLNPLTMLNKLTTVLNHCLEDNAYFQTALSIVGRYLGADRVSLYMKPLVSDRYQWRRPNVLNSYRRTYRWMLENEWPALDEWMVSVSSEYGMRKHYKYYFKRYGIRNLICISIEGIRREKAYLVIENACRTEQDQEIYKALHNCFSLMLKTVEMGIIDEQTGVYNRDFFTKYLVRLSRLSIKSLGIVVMNLNNMHQYTSVYGQAAGDELLMHTANIILGHGEAISFRTDGDEFAAVMTNRSEREMEKMMQEISAECRTMNIGLSMGSQWRDRSIRPEEMYHAADASMREYKAKYYSTRNIVQK